MSRFFNKIAGLLDSSQFQYDDFDPPISLPPGTRILVAPPNLPEDIRWANITEEGKRDVDADGCITVPPRKLHR
jgi:hypothetical protein